MTSPDIPLGLLGKSMSWLKNFADMPRAVAILAKAHEADRDPRSVCLACGGGRVAMALSRPRTIDQRQFRTRYGRCESCRVWWEVSLQDGSAMRLVELIGGQGDDAPPMMVGEHATDHGRHVGRLDA